ncbi:MAG TPA: FHA domain-containing protein, partial [Pyrinomonadaceae bacterium]|nr:FHA domain-containing protein [Pyrinomonadaceae bacterium]
MTTNARLIAISGPTEGTTFALTEAEVSIGREPSNLICVNDHSVSRRHCLIRREGELFKLIDLESYNGTFVNAVPIGEQSLSHGDQIAVGSVRFLFLSRESESIAPDSLVELADDELINPSTIRLAQKDALYLRPAAVIANLPADSRIARDLNALLRISTLLGTIRDSTQFQRSLLEIVLDTIPAERGAILLVGENSEEVIASYGTDKKSQTQQPVRISRSVVEKVLREGEAILCL